MSNNHHTFPWGIYIGDLTDEDNSLPVCLPSQTGGFCVLFDDDSDTVANNFIENIALKLFEVLPVGALNADIFDFSHKKRFMHLASLRGAGLYHIALGANEATSLFNELEKIALHRHHHLLSFKAPTLSQYNQHNSVLEKYHLLIINLEHYPDDLASYKRFKEFFDSSFEAGFYCIAFGNKTILETESKSTQYLLNRFPTIDISNKKIHLNNTLFEFADLAKDYDFDYVNDNKDLIIETLLHSLHKDEASDEKEFLSIPIGKSTDGQHDIHFTLGDKSKNYHAFITGVAGSGKTTLLNNIIVSIAEQYSHQQIRLYLMDYKEGVEFQVFKNHPNCEKIFLDNEDLDASITLLEDFTRTIKNRSDLFKANELKDIGGYNQHYPQAPMERLILIIDEVHRLFAGNYKQKEHFSNLLKQVVRQGRAFGVHIILSTQTLAGTQIDKELMSQITLRVSFKLTDPRDSETIFTYNNTEALNLGKHELIVNNDSGKKTANSLCRANPPQDIKAALSAVLATRDTSQILTPVIVTSALPPTAETQAPPINETTPQQPPKNYNTQSETELLKKLIAEGKIQAPKGFEDLMKGDK
jgi:hypothetical protein